MYKRQTYNNAKACKIKYLSIYLNKYWILKCFDTISSGIYIHRISIKLNIKVVDQPNEGRSNPRKVCFLPTCITGLVSGFDEINWTNVSIVGTPLTITENHWQNIIKTLFTFIFTCVFNIVFHNRCPFISCVYVSLERPIKNYEAPCSKYSLSETLQESKYEQARDVNGAMASSNPQP